MNLPPASLHSGSDARTDLVRERRANLLDRVAAACLVAMPLAMWLANRSAPLLLGLSALAVLAAVWSRGGLFDLALRLRRDLSGPVGLAVMAFLLWSLVSLASSHRPVQGIAMWGELLLPLLCGLVLASSAGWLRDPFVPRALAIAVILAAGLIMIELASGVSQRAELGIGRPFGFIFNRSVLTCVVLMAAVLPRLFDRSGGRTGDRWLGGLLVLVVSLLAVVSDSGAAVLGFALLVLAWMSARLAPRLTLAAVGLCFGATMALAPAFGVLSSAAIPPAMHETLAQSHTRERIAIWLSFGEAIRARPVFGSGFGASTALNAHPVAADVPPQHREMLAAGHPHSAPMQVWVETGFVGAACLTVAGLAVLWRLRRLHARDLAPRLALFAMAFGVASVAHGAWQGWWIAVLAAASVLLWTELNAGHEAA